MSKYIYCSKGNKTSMKEVDGLKRVLEYANIPFSFYEGTSDYDPAFVQNSAFIISLPLTANLKEKPANLECVLNAPKLVSVFAKELENQGKKVFAFSVGRGGYSEIKRFLVAPQGSMDKVYLYYQDVFYKVEDFTEYSVPDWKNGFAGLICTTPISPDAMVSILKSSYGF